MAKVFATGFAATLRGGVSHLLRQGNSRALMHCSPGLEAPFKISTAPQVPHLRQCFQRITQPPKNHAAYVSSTSRGFHTTLYPLAINSERRAGASGRLSFFMETFFHAPAQVLVGVSIGGLGATLAGLVYFLWLAGDLSVTELVEKGPASILAEVQKLDGFSTRLGSLEVKVGNANALKTAVRPSGRLVVALASAFPVSSAWGGAFDTGLSNIFSSSKVLSFHFKAGKATHPDFARVFEHGAGPLEASPLSRG
ncbi:hypothetical protein CYMTET_18202 [Cymbomonas tetramitiformis]|uniref:Uncharacterized protein n=1 Tax=Cymbomonas tetramitiformis TaxID=36881 RepID=A0AAE0G8F5_9CHLO|nr:hypothetical protein CYMTET_18202 [Cymbomonas tetramitiformis]